MNIETKRKIYDDMVETIKERGIHYKEAADIASYQYWTQMYVNEFGELKRYLKERYKRENKELFNR